MAKKRIKRNKVGAANRITGPEMAAMYEQLLGSVVSHLIQELLPVVDDELDLDGLAFREEALTVFAHVAKHLVGNMDPLLMPILGLQVGSGIRGKDGTENAGEQYAVALTWRGGVKKRPDDEPLVRVVVDDENGETFAEMDMTLRVNVSMERRRATDDLEVVGSEAKSAADLILPGG